MILYFKHIIHIDDFPLNGHPPSIGPIIHIHQIGPANHPLFAGSPAFLPDVRRSAKSLKYPTILYERNTNIEDRIELFHRNVTTTNTPPSNAE